MFRVEFTEHALKELKKLDPYTQRLLINWIKNNLIDCINPRAFGKALVGNKKGMWRYRVGDYRLLTQIKDDILIILVISVGHRKDIYN